MSLEELARLMADPPVAYRPEVRWWLAEGLHTDETLRREIDTARRLGFGGMEFLAMDEQGIDHARYGWGAEEWVHDSEVVVEETTRRDMAVSFTSGTNWSNANLPTIGPDHPAAAQELDVATVDLAAGATFSGALPRTDPNATGESMIPGERAEVHDQHFTAVVAGRVLGTTPVGGVVLDIDSLVDLTASVSDPDGAAELIWTAPDSGAPGGTGEWRLFAYWLHGTGQTASPSASVNYTVNYLDRAGVDAVMDYWDTVVLTPRLRELIKDNPRVQLYMDSLELSTFGSGGLLWGRAVLTEFHDRRGYDARRFLPLLTRTNGMMVAQTQHHNEPDEAHRELTEKVRFDCLRTLTDLYIENMLRPLAAFLHDRGIGLRSEISYGLPFELTRPGPEVDGIETESLEFGSQIDAYRLLAGPAHLFGKQYSSETGATTRNHILDHRFYDQIIATQLAAGITKTVLHGWASTAGAEGSTHWPGHEGMWPMFSERFDTRQPGSECYPQWTTALARLQGILRQGRPRIDVGILRTDHLTDNMGGMALLDPDGTRVPDEQAYGRRWMRDRRNHWWADLGMQDAGWSYEFFDGTLLLHDQVRLGADDGGNDHRVVQPDGPGYQALIVFQTGLDPDVARRLLDWARRGLPIALVHGAREVRLLLADAYHVHERAASRTQGNDGRDAELAATIAELLACPNVASVDDPAGTLAALRGLGVVGRAEFAADNPDVLGHLREDGDLLHCYLYHFRYVDRPETEVEVALPGVGAVHRLDAWTGRLHAHAGVRFVDGRTLARVRLAPGETVVLTLDRGAPPISSEAVEPVVVAELGEWAITVDSWDAGEPEVITEDRGLGYVSREVRPTTKITTIDAGTGLLRPWRELAGVGPEVSGVATYAATVTVADVEDAQRYLLDLGSTAGGLATVSVNGSDPRGCDTSHPVVDVSDLLHSGANTVVVRATSSLNNRLLARGYYDELRDVVSMFSGTPTTQQTEPHDHGLLGPVRLITTAGEGAER